MGVRYARNHRVTKTLFLVPLNVACRLNRVIGELLANEGMVPLEPGVSPDESENECEFEDGGEDGGEGFDEIDH